MKTIKEATVCVVDYGSFISLAECIGQKAKKTYCYTPFESEYLDVRDCIKAFGLPNVERLDEYLDPENLKEIDLFVFPDRGYGGVQRLLKSMGKAVWGSLGGCELEEYRTKFLSVLKETGLPVVNSVRVKGLTALAEHLKGVTDKWVKINRYRENMETWHHLDYQHSERMLESLSVIFGPVKEHIVFIVQDPINDDDGQSVVEIGYDGWFTGEFPESSFQGYEKKNELYLGSRLSQEEIPAEVRHVNDAMAPVLERYGYCNFWATEIRKKGEVSYFIDPTARMPGQTGEQLLNTCSNLPEIIWAGANGQIVQPEFDYDFAVEATLHYTAGGPEDWKTVRVPEELKPWTKFYNYCFLDGAYHFAKHRNDEIGVLIGVGDTASEAIDHLKENIELFKDEPVCVRLEGFADLLKDVEKAESEGMEFSDQPLPDPCSVLE